MPTHKTQKSPRHPNADRPMSSDAAQRLAATMRTTCEGLELFASVDRDERGERITFVGGRWGAHSLSINVTSEERARIHWLGYCESNGITLPLVDAHALAKTGIVPKVRVRFRSESSSTRWRTGVVTRVTPTRCLIAFRYRTQRGKGVQHTTWRKLNDIVLVSGRGTV